MWYSSGEPPTLRKAAIFNGLLAGLFNPRTSLQDMIPDRDAEANPTGPTTPTPEGEAALTRLRKPVLERLMRYYQFLIELTAGKPVQSVTSAQIAKRLDIDPTQVRKDFSAIGLVGIGRVGFDILAVCRAIRVVLGFDREYEAVLVGTGHLGTALAEYSGFARYGLRIVAAFDNDQNRVGGEIAGCKIRSTMLMKSCIRKGNIRLAILTTPAEASQGLADRLVSAGVKAIWNFSPTRLTVPSDVLVRNEHISIGLSQIAYHLKQME